MSPYRVVVLQHDDGTMLQSSTGQASPRVAKAKRMAPGLLVCFAVGAVSTALALPLPGVSGLLIAIVIGILWRNIAPYPEALKPGIAVAAKPVLRIGIVLLGLQLVIGDILGLGPWVIVAVFAAVGLTFWATMVVGRWLKMSLNQRLLIASGFSICGAAAVAGTDSVTDSDEEEVATAIAMVVVFGTLMIPLMPVLAALLNFTPEQTGLLIGLSTHEVAQVVAAGGIVGGGALAVAVTVKLARVLLLAPILTGIALSRRRREGEAAEGEKKKRPPVVPFFVIGFLVLVGVRSTGIVPTGVLEVTQVLQGLALATAMFALGLNVHFKSLVKVGGRPVVLAASSTAVIILVGCAAVVLPELMGFSSV